jgi:hypothetical protein
MNLTQFVLSCNSQVEGSGLQLFWKIMTRILFFFVMKLQFQLGKILNIPTVRWARSLLGINPCRRENNNLEIYCHQAHQMAGMDGLGTIRMTNL